MEDLQEQKLDQEAAARANRNSLQHALRAPTSAQQSSQTYSTQEQTFREEDEEAIERQRKIKELLDEDDAKWKEERRRKIMGRYADAKDSDEIQRLLDEEMKKIDEGMSC